VGPIAIAITLGVGACSATAGHGNSTASNAKASTSATSGQPTKPAPPTLWEKTISKVKPDGTVSTATALTAFAEAIGPVPGVTPPPGPTGQIPSGTIAVRWVFSRWAQLTEAQRAAVKADLGAPAVHHFAGGTADNSADDPNIPCQTKDAAGTQPYRAEFNGIVNALTAHLWPLTVRDQVFFADNTRSIDPNDPTSNGKSILAYNVGCVGGSTPAGKISGCTVHMNPGQVASNVHDILIHELMHCFMEDKFGQAAYVAMPSWFVEGGAQWAQTALGTGDTVSLNWWHSYLDLSEVPLDKMSYGAIGFFAHLAETGTDPWTRMAAMGAAMAGNKNSTAAGWRAADPSDKFLNTWASGFAQGRYPGGDWVTGGPNLDHYPPVIFRQDNLENGSLLPVSSVAFASSLLEMNVHADVAQIIPTDGNVHSGLVSLGGQAESTVDAATGVNYCTLSAEKCRCPKDSDQPNAQFVHMEHGAEWVGITGGANPAAVQARGISIDDFCKNRSKLVGTWRSTSITSHSDYHGEGEDSHGAAGVTLTIDATGNMSVAYAGMDRSDYERHTHFRPVSGYVTWDGIQNGVIPLPPTKATSGPWRPKAGSNSVTVHNTITAPAVLSESGTLDSYLSSGYPGLIPATNPGTWSLSGNTLRLSLTYRGPLDTATGTWTLRRVGGH